jgi:hypothetical protein
LSGENNITVTRCITIFAAVLLLAGCATQKPVVTPVGKVTLTPAAQAKTVSAISPPKIQSSSSTLLSNGCVTTTIHGRTVTNCPKSFVTCFAISNNVYATGCVLATTNFKTWTTNQFFTNSAVEIVSNALLYQFFGLRVMTVGIMLGWNVITNPFVDGVNVYWGGASRTYTNFISGGTTSALITGLMPNVVYYFAATTFSVNGQESAFSSEVKWTNQPPIPTMSAYASK